MGAIWKALVRGSERLVVRLALQRTNNLLFNLNIKMFDKRTLGCHLVFFDRKPFDDGLGSYTLLLIE